MPLFVFERSDIDAEAGEEERAKDLEAQDSLKIRCDLSSRLLFKL